MQAALLFFALLTCCGACVPGQQGGVSRAAYSRGKGAIKGSGSSPSHSRPGPPYLHNSQRDKRKTSQLSGIPKFKLDLCKNLIRNGNPIASLAGDSINCKEVLKNDARFKRKLKKQKPRRPKPVSHEVTHEVSNHIEEIEEVFNIYDEGVYYDEVETNYEESPFPQQTFFTSSETPDFASVIPEFTSEKFFEAVIPQDQFTHSHPIGDEHTPNHPHSSDGHTHTPNHPHSSDGHSHTTQKSHSQQHVEHHGHTAQEHHHTQQDISHENPNEGFGFTVQPYTHEVAHDNSNSDFGFTIKPYVHETSERGSDTRWTPSSPDPNIGNTWTTPKPKALAGMPHEDPFSSWTTTSAPASAPQRLWTTFAPERVTVKQAVAPPPTHQTQPLVGDIQVTSNPWPSQFTSDLLNQVGKASFSPESPKAFFASPAPGYGARSKKDIAKPKFPNTFFDFGKQNQPFAQAKVSVEKAKPHPFQNTFSQSPEAEIVDLVIPDPLSPGHPQGNGNHGWAPLEEWAREQRENFLNTGGSWSEQSQSSQTQATTPQAPTLFTSTVLNDQYHKQHHEQQPQQKHHEQQHEQQHQEQQHQQQHHEQQHQQQYQPHQQHQEHQSQQQQLGQKSPVNHHSVRAQWESALQRDLPMASEVGAAPAEVKTTQPSKWEGEWVQPKNNARHWNKDKTQSPVVSKTKWEGEWVQPRLQQTPSPWQKREIATAKVTPAPTTTTSKAPLPKAVSPIQEWAQTPLEKFAEIPSFESMKQLPRKTITTINKWRGPTTTTAVVPRAASYSPVTQPSAVRSFPESFPGTVRSSYGLPATPFTSFDSDTDLSHLLGPTGAPGIAYIHTDAPKTAQQLHQLGQANINSNSHYMAQNPFLATPRPGHSNIYLGSPTPASASVKRNIDQNQYWNYNPTTERSAVKSYDPFRNAVWDPPSVSEASTVPKITVVLPESQAEDKETTPHETASKITGYSYKSVSRPGSGEKEDYNSLHYSSSS